MTHCYSIAGAFAAFLLAIATFAAPAAAQTGKLTGVVTDQQTGQPVPGAQITVEELGRTILTNERGIYFLINLPPGVYTVSAQVLGYATVRRENVQVSIDVTRRRTSRCRRRPSRSRGSSSRPTGSRSRRADRPPPSK